MPKGSWKLPKSKAAGHSVPPSGKEYVKGRLKPASTPQQNHSELYLRVSTPDQKPDLNVTDCELMPSAPVSI